ncbi:hypothetical protein [uncultured Bifidobacterium sp.]|uniref:hypothetical protein n=1 Tax=uncultured Bifidobacterium sp. TaxID=165187 RepID=UPI0028DD2174|nr:hypothetical protein [uncultured Bifidobacterium sp.]
MPWWIWLVLVAFMLVCLTTGVALAVRSGLRALHDASAVSDRVSAHLERMSEPSAERPAEPASFARPLRLTAARYGDARVGVERRARRRRDRHREIWRSWTSDGSGRESAADDPGSRHGLVG